MNKKKDDTVFKVKASPYFWRQKAEELKYAAEIIWPHAELRMDKINQSIKEKKKIDIEGLEPNIFSIFLSLLGYSTEALFKGVIIRDNPSYVSNGTLSFKLTNHDLIKLATIGKISLSQHERIFCKQANKAMTVDSRYPIPKGSHDIQSSMEIGGNCKDVFTGIYYRLYPELGKFNGLKI